MRSPTEDRKYTVGRIEFEPKGMNWNINPLAGRLEALAKGLSQLSEVLLIIDGRLTEMTKQLDRMENRRFKSPMDRP